eukprot:scaffold731_cov261-Pinguiococcus_pyrenoidosus.AAC.94
MASTCWRAKAHSVTSPKRRSPSLSRVEACPQAERLCRARATPGGCDSASSEGSSSPSCGRNALATTSKVSTRSSGITAPCSSGIPVPCSSGIPAPCSPVSAPAFTKALTGRSAASISQEEAKWA